MSKVSLYLLNVILIVVSSWLGLTLISIFLNDFFNLISFLIDKLFLLTLFYVMFVTLIIGNFILVPNIDFYREESLF